MKLQEEQIENEIVTQIFLSIEEAENKENQKIIDELKEDKGNVVLFLSGYEDTKKILHDMVQTFKIE